MTTNPITQKRKYKVELTKSFIYVFDVLSENEEKAKEIAEKQFLHAEDTGYLHYHEDFDPQLEVTNVYDVTETDDPFNPEQD